MQMDSLPFAGQFLSAMSTDVVPATHRKVVGASKYAISLISGTVLVQGRWKKTTPRCHFHKRREAQQVYIYENGHTHERWLIEGGFGTSLKDIPGSRGQGGYPRRMAFIEQYMKMDTPMTIG
ncbi:hypothetical protein NHQ30_009273 [Ciborinia camelliae]|nr:hypothetical protein NHQ30_009273 [Ciborinia camelliae]